MSEERREEGGEPGEQPLDARDWEQTRGEAQQEETDTSVEHALVEDDPPPAEAAPADARDG